MGDSTPRVRGIATVLRRIRGTGIESVHLMSSDATTSPRFRVWIRRETESEGPFSIRFEVEEGKGLLRVARPGVLIDPPASPTGAESRLTGQQLRASRFLHVWDSGRSRQGYSLTRVDEAASNYGLPGLLEFYELMWDSDGDALIEFQSMLADPD